MNKQSLSNRIEGYTFPLYNKKDVTSKQSVSGEVRRTGLALNLEKVENLCVISIDGERALELVEKLLNEDQNVVPDYIVKTPTGYHVYCNTGLCPLFMNNNTDCFLCPGYSVSVYCSVERTPISITLENSLVLYQRRNFEYTVVQGSMDNPITRTLTDVLHDLDIRISPVQLKRLEDIKHAHKYDGRLTDNICEMILDALTPIQVDDDDFIRDDPELLEHETINYMLMFPAVNTLNGLYAQRAYDILGFGAEFDIIQQFSYYKSNEYILIEIIKCQNPNYYNQYLKHALYTSRVINQIDFDDPFTMKDIHAKASSYDSEAEVVADLSKVIRFIQNGKMMYLVKTFDPLNNRMMIQYTSAYMMKRSLSLMSLPKLSEDKRKKRTVFDVCSENLAQLSVLGVKFTGDPFDDNIYVMFHGYKYAVQPECNHRLIEPFLTFIWQDICNSDSEIYTYVMNWVAFIIKNPGRRTETALVLKGPQGIGKNTFTNTICELLAGYALPNITDIREIIGKNNGIIEDRMLIVMNEMRNYGESYMANFDTLKSRITDPVIHITQTGQPVRDVENVTNYIFVSNHPRPIFVEPGDRRYVIIDCSAAHKGDHEFWESLCSKMDNDFYAHLFTYFNNMSIDDFNPHEIPMNESKQKLIELGHSELEEWLCAHYNRLCNGMKVLEAQDKRPQHIRLKKFALFMSDCCSREIREIDGKKISYYVLKPESKDMYHQTRL